MDVKAYINNLNSISSSGLQCKYCGSEVSAGGESSAMCHFCESYVDTEKSSITNDAQFSQLLVAQEAINNETWETAAKYFDSSVEKSTDPYKFYSAANFYQNYSDYKYNYTDYNLMGFMEQNAENKDTAKDSISKSKEFFFMTIKLAENQLKKGSDESLLYLKFMSNIKLDRIVQGNVVLEDINKLKNDNLIADYANMVYNVESNGKETEASVEKLLRENEVNAYFYLARHLVKKKKLGEAASILDVLTKKVRMPMAKYLLKKINEVQEETKV